MSQSDKRAKVTSNMLPLLNYKYIISLVVLLLVTSSSTQTPPICPTDCVCQLADFSARCENLDSLIASYSKKHLSSRLMPIKSLDLSNNGLTKISNQLEVLVNLTELNLSHNKLTQVQKLNFQHLEKLDLSHNHITSGKLSKLPRNIVSLNLAHNDITYLPVDFMKMKKLRNLDLHENPLNCTCDTLHVRNWMSYQNVWSSKVIVCSAPQQVKGLPWLQARQNDVCLELSTTTIRNYKWDDLDGNDIMMGDQPDTIDENVKDIEYDEGIDDLNEETGDDDKKNIFDEEMQQDENNEAETEKDEHNELKEEFIPVPADSQESTSVEPEVDSSSSNDDEGSGHVPEPIIMATKEDEKKQEEEYDDGSGSGDGIIPVVPLIQSTSEKAEENEDPTEETTLPAIIEKGSKPDLSLGIFEDFTDPPIIIPDVQKNKIEPEPVEAVPESEKSSVDDKKGDIKMASPTDDNTGTYVLLVIIGILLISLIIFVAYKNRQEKRQARRKYDVEKNGATELQDMDKRLLGKPLEKNGNGKQEHSPLINGDDHPQEFTSFKPPEITVDEPIQELPHKENGKSQQSLYDTPNGNGGIHEPVHQPGNGSLPKSPDSDEDVFHPATDAPVDQESLNTSPEPPKRYSPVYPPVSPRSARYSPVYSPETGRVKIKLTETPKPKTPVVVTRSRSRAGDYVNTPNNN